jgi:hypothetical protein
MSSKNEVKAVLAEMLIRFPKHDFPAPTSEAYAMDLMDIPIDQLRQVCQRLWLTEEWFPSVGKIRKAWCEQQVPDTCAEDLTWVKRRMGRLAPGEQPNPYSPVVQKPKEWPNPVCARTVDLIGWGRLYDTDPNYLPKLWADHYVKARQEEVAHLSEFPALAAQYQRPALKVVGQ